MKRIVAGFSMLVCALAAHAQTTPVTCSAATLNGIWSVDLTGRVVSSAGAFSKAYYGIGTATFDGVSAVTFTLTTNTNQAEGVAQTLAGTYTLPANCVGTVAITSGDTA